MEPSILVSKISWSTKYLGQQNQVAQRVHRLRPIGSAGYFLSELAELKS
jgi:hypothetical protein